MSDNEEPASAGVLVLLCHAVAILVRYGVPFPFSSTKALEVML